MKITLDTKEDNYEDIKKVLHIFTEILEKKGQAPSSLSTSSPVNTAPLMSMFDAPAETQQTEKAPDFSSFLNLAKTPEKKEALPRIEIF